jgi:hypothetical protein
LVVVVVVVVALFPTTILVEAVDVAVELSIAFPATTSPPITAEARAEAAAAGELLLLLPLLLFVVAGG